jgi:hypothetical protein
MGSLGVGTRLSTRGKIVALGMDAGAHGYAYHDFTAQVSGGGITAEAMPLLRAGGGSMHVEARSGLLHHTRAVAGTVDARTVHQTDARLVLRGGGLSVPGEGRYLRASEGFYPYVGAGVNAGAERLHVSAYAGSWLVQSISTPVWGIAARLPLGSMAEAHVGFHQETNDPLFWNVTRRNWNAGLSYRFGTRPRQMAASLPISAAAGTTFRLPLSASASAPAVAGDFSDWQAVPMLRVGHVWSVTTPIARGVYRYAFRGANGEWFVPEGSAGREADGYGGFNAVLIVP